MKRTLLAIAILAALQPMRAGRRFTLSGEDDATTRRVITNAVSLAEGQHRSWVTVTRTGSFTDPRYGRFEITPKMLADMVRNFDAGVVGTDIFIDVDHKPGDGAAAKVLALRVDNGRLRAQVEWTEHGVDAVRRKGFTYLSAEFHDDWHDNEKGDSHGCTLLGAGLTIRPVIKRLDPVTLAVAGSASDLSGPVFVHPGLVRQLTESLENTTMNRFKKFLARLTAAGITLSAAQIESLRGAFETATKSLAEDADDTAICDQFETVAKALADAPANTTMQLSVNVDHDNVADAVAKALAERDTAAATAATSQATARQAFTDTLGEAKALSEATREQLAPAAELIGPGWTVDQAKALAAQQVKAGEAIEAARQLAQLGYQPAGQVRVTVDEGNAIKQLSAAIHTGLKNSYVGDQLKLPAEDKLNPFQRKVLAQFDAEHAHKLHAEAKQLAGGAVESGDLSLPASYQRAVLLEALADNRVLELVSTNVDPQQGPVHTIKYERRDTSAVVNDGVVYEGNEIPPGGVSIENDYAYIVPMKISLDLTNESIFFSRNSALMNYDAWGRTLVSNAQVMRENVGRRIANHMQRESAAYGAVAEVAVAFTDSTANAGTYRAAAGKFPIVRPFQARDLKGTAIGAEQHPLTVKVAGAAVQPYNGTGTQTAGNYYRVVNWNLGLVQIVTEAGVPKAGLTVTADYYRETNLVLFDLDVPSGDELEKHLNGLIRAIGSRKATMSQDRFVQPNFGLMAATLNDTATNAEQFTASGARADSAITALGDLAPLKGVPSYSTNAPNLDLGEERIQMGQRGALSYTIAKPFSVGTPFEAVGANGRPTGRKIAYGEEFSSIHVPSEYRQRFTAVVAYSKAAREA
jgi:hypothetical protein